MSQRVYAIAQSSLRYLFITVQRPEGARKITNLTPVPLLTLDFAMDSTGRGVMDSGTVIHSQTSAMDQLAYPQ